MVSLSWHLVSPGIRTELDPAMMHNRSRHFTTLYIFIVYLILLLVPWLAACIYSSRPSLSTTSYEDAHGKLSPEALESVTNWTTTIRAFNTMVAIITIPVVSTVLTHAAVVYAQRQNASNKLSPRQLLSLADEPWARLTASHSSGFSLLALVLLTYCVLFSLVRAVAIKPEEMRVLSCLDDPDRRHTGPGCELRNPSTFLTLGYDPTPASVDAIPRDRVVKRIADKLVTEQVATEQPHLWYYQSNDPMPRSDISQTNTLSSYLTNPNRGDSYFVSALPSTTNTGMLRESAMRLNSSITCELVGYKSFPSSCNGTQSIEGEFRDAGIQVKFCVFQAPTSTTLGSSDGRLQIHEELFLDSTIPGDSEIRNMAVRANYTARCTANSTRDYFELPNLRGGGSAEPSYTTKGIGEMLERRSNCAQEFGPDDAKIANRDTAYVCTPATHVKDVKLPVQFVSSLSADHLSNSPRLASKTTTPPTTQQAPGPLVLAVHAALGNGSFLDLARSAGGSDDRKDAARLAAAASICTRGLPLWSFTRQNVSNACAGLYDTALDPNDTSSQSQTSPGVRLDVLVASWFAAFNPGGPQGKAKTESALAAGLFFASEALLMGAAEPVSGRTTATQREMGATDDSAPRPIHSAMGTSIIKPSVSTAAIGILSFFLVVEVLVLAALSTVACCSRTIGTRFKAANLLFAGAQLRDELIPPDKSTSVSEKKGIEVKVTEKRGGMKAHPTSKKSVVGGNKTRPRSKDEHPNIKETGGGRKKVVQVTGRESQDSLVRNTNREDSSGSPSRSSSLSSWAKDWKKVPMPLHLSSSVQAAAAEDMWFSFLSRGDHGPERQQAAHGQQSQSEAGAAPPVAQEPHQFMPSSPCTRTVSFAEGGPEKITVRREKAQAHPLHETGAVSPVPEGDVAQIEQGAERPRLRVSGPYSGFCQSPTFNGEVASPLRELSIVQRRGSIE